MAEEFRFLVVKLFATRASPNVVKAKVEVCERLLRFADVDQVMASVNGGLKRSSSMVELMRELITVGTTDLLLDAFKDWVADVGVGTF